MFFVTAGFRPCSLIIREPDYNTLFENIKIINVKFDA